MNGYTSIYVDIPWKWKNIRNFTSFYSANPAVYKLFELWYTHGVLEESRNKAHCRRCGDLVGHRMHPKQNIGRKTRCFPENRMSPLSSLGTIMTWPVGRSTRKECVKMKNRDCQCENRRRKEEKPELRDFCGIKDPMPGESEVRMWIEWSNIYEQNNSLYTGTFRRDEGENHPGTNGSFFAEAKISSVPLLQTQDDCRFWRYTRTHWD